MGDLCEVATVDHGLRPESAAEARLVAAIADELGLRHETLTVDLAPGNLQAAARTARYAALIAWSARRGLPALATAHHADDQAETVVMRLNRGSGLAGLAGIRECTWIAGGSLAVVRPLLGWRKHELESIVHGAGLAPVRDPSNEDDAFDRVRVRRALAGADWLDPLAIAQSARHAGDADRLLRQMIGEDFAACVEVAGDVARYYPRRSGKVAGYELVFAGVVARILERCFQAQPRMSEVHRMVANLGLGARASLAGCLAEPADSEEGPVWTFRPEPPRRT